MSVLRNKDAVGVGTPDQTGPLIGPPTVEAIRCPLERQQHVVDSAYQLAAALERRYLRLGSPACVCSDQSCFRCQTTLARKAWADENLTLARMFVGAEPGEKTEAERVADGMSGLATDPYHEKMWEDD